jgi:cytidine deaminase
MTATHTFSYEIFDNFDALSAENKELVLAAEKISENAYAPYSEFFVGAAARLENGEIYACSNQENAAFPSGMCAEAGLLSFVGANFATQGVRALAISAQRKGAADKIALSPCGNCRQILLETEKRQKNKILIIMPLDKGQFAVLKSVAFLLPFSFSSDNLTNNNDI